MTGKDSAEHARLEREWQRTRAAYRNDTDHYGFGTDKEKDAWKRRITKTRTF